MTTNIVLQKADAQIVLQSVGGSPNSGTVFVGSNGMICFNADCSTRIVLESGRLRTYIDNELIQDL